MRHAMGWSCLIVLAGACFTGRTTLHLLEPADFTLPAQIRRLSVLPEIRNTNKAGQFDSLAFIEIDSSIEVYPIKAGFLHGAIEIMSASPRFAFVGFSENLPEMAIDSGLTGWKLARYICQSDTSDALLILAEAVVFDSLCKYTPSGDPYLMLMNKTRWGFFDPFAQQMVAQYRFVDTTYLPIEGISEERLYQSCYASGMHSARKFTPHWNEQANRIYYSGPGSDLRTASLMVRRGDWSGAASIWNRLAENRGTLSRRAAFNLALAFEQDDQLDQALLWAHLADSINSGKRSGTYIKILNGRLKVREILNKQIN